MQDAARFILMYLVFPLWVVAGFVDWACHRRTDIAHTSGLRENLLHLLMFAEIGVGMLAVALLEVNAAVLLIVTLVFIVHELTVYWDLHYTSPLRRIGPFEQMVHSFLELLPLLSLALLAVMAWPQALALVGAGNVPADWTLRPKSDPLPGSYLVAGFLAAALFNGLPLLQETWSCLKARTPARPAPR
ncbi:MAG: diguanylate cyclase [Pseudomonadota bacterium]